MKWVWLRLDRITLDGDKGLSLVRS